MARIPVECSEDMKYRFHKAVFEEDKTMSEVIRSWISDYLTLYEKNRETA